MSTLEVGSNLGGYRILARLRAGAMGVLYLARRDGAAEFSRPVAIKVIHDHLAQNARFCRMFIDEAKLSARIDHPNVVRVEEFGKADGRYYLVMEYVYGVSLAQAIGVLHASGRIPIDIAVAIAIEIAGGLHGAHEATNEDGTPLGIVHRDVSPHNVLVSYTGAVRVIDFGIAKARQVGGQTRTGSLRGKLAYMPPEQARSARTVDRRADLYALGLILWEMLTFRRVFDADTDIAILNQIRNPMIVPPSALAANVPRALDDIIMRTLAKDPSARPQSGLQLQRALAEAFPTAQRVLSSDIAALMAKVRTTATSLAEGNDDPSGLYGEEVRRTLTIIGKGMYDPEPGGDGVDTHPRRVDIDKEHALASVIVAGDPPVTSDEDTTAKHPAGPPVARPVRETPEPPMPSMPSISPMAAMAATPTMMSHSPQSATVARNIGPPPASPPGMALSPQQKLALAFLVPFAGAMLIGMGIVIGGRTDPPSAAPSVPVPVAVPVTPPVMQPTAVVTSPMIAAPPYPPLAEDAGARRPPRGRW